MTRLLARLLLATLLASCHKDVQPSSGVDLYIVGMVNPNIATLWKNQMPVSEGWPEAFKNHNFSATAIYIQQKDLWIGGTAMKFSAIWQNTNFINLMADEYSPAAAVGNVYSVFADETDYYAAGVETNWNGSWAVYWKNRMGYALSNNKNSRANRIVGYNGDAYIIGIDSGKSVMWKNWVVQTFFTGKKITSVTASDVDVYVTGSSCANSCSAVYWKNEVIVQLPGGTSASGLWVIGKDVYVSGWDCQSNSCLPVYWKNGALVNRFPPGTYAPHIVATATDIYLADIQGNEVTLWKNLVATPISISGSANDVFLAGRGN